MTKTSGYLLYFCWFDDFTPHAFFTSMEKLEGYTKEFIPNFKQDGWCVIEVPIDPTEEVAL